MSLAISNHRELKNLLAPGKVHHLGALDAGEYDDFFTIAQHVIPVGSPVLVLAIDMKPGEICYQYGGLNTFLYDPGRSEWSLLKDELMQKAGGDSAYIPLVYAVNGDLYSIPLSNP